MENTYHNGNLEGVHGLGSVAKRLARISQIAIEEKKVGKNFPITMFMEDEGSNPIFIFRANAMKKKLKGILGKEELPIEIKKTKAKGMVKVLFYPNRGRELAKADPMKLDRLRNSMMPILRRKIDESVSGEFGLEIIWGEFIARESQIEIPDILFLEVIPELLSEQGFDMEVRQFTYLSDTYAKIWVTKK